MSVRAKFKVTSITRTLGARSEVCPSPEHCPVGARYHDAAGRHSVPTELQTITMNPVYANGDPNHENSKFWQATPSGQLTLGTVNAEAAAYFELEGEYYIDFTRGDEPATVIVNGQLHAFEGNVVTYEAVSSAAGFSASSSPSVMYHVKGTNNGGSLRRGQSITCHGTYIFDVAVTGNA